MFEQVNFNDLLPAAPAGKVNVKWQANPPTAVPRNISAYVDPPGSGGSSTTYKEVPVTSPPSSGNFQVAHGFGSTPRFALITMTSGGEIWLQSPVSFDSTYLYLTASDGGLTATITVFGTAADAEISLAPGVPGPFTVAHGLGASPEFAAIEMLSSGEIWFSTSPMPWDATNLYLVASDSAVQGKAEVWRNAPVIANPSFVLVNLAPSSPGNFTIAHGLGAVPAIVVISMSSGGEIWLQNPTGFDQTNLYLTASDGGITGIAAVWGGGSGSSGLPTPLEIALSPGAGGNFQVAHGLGSKPKVVLLQMTSSGAIWFQTARYDATYIYLVASDGGVTGYAEVWS